jgi:hypothetical protein
VLLACLRADEVPIVRWATGGAADAPPNTRRSTAWPAQ